MNETIDKTEDFKDIGTHKFVSVYHESAIGAPNEYNMRSYSKIFNEMGYKSYIVSFDYNSVQNLHFTDENISFYTFGVKSNNSNYILRLLERGNKIKSASETLELFNYLGDKDIVINWGRNWGKFYNILKRKNRERKFKLIYYVCEWWNIKRWFAKVDNPKTFLKQLVSYVSMRYAEITARNQHIISDSRQLAEPYERKGCKCLTIPNLMECDEFYTPIEGKDGFLSIGFFGNPGVHNTKDLFVNIVKGLALLDEDEKKRVIFHVYGILENDLEKLYDIDAKTQSAVKNVMTVHGMIPKDKVKGELQRCDFTVLLRDNTSHAIYASPPSKITESICFGVPVICNISSDVEKECLTDGYNAIISPSNAPEDFARCIRKAIKLTAAEKRILKINAYESAKKYVDWRNYVEPVKIFISEILKEEIN